MTVYLNIYKRYNFALSAKNVEHNENLFSYVGIGYKINEKENKINWTRKSEEVGQRPAKALIIERDVYVFIRDTPQIIFWRKKQFVEKI